VHAPFTNSYKNKSPELKQMLASNAAISNNGNKMHKSAGIPKIAAIK